MRVIMRFLCPPSSAQCRAHYPSCLQFENSITNAQASKSHFLFPLRDCAAMYSYQVPLFSADPLTKHSFQFDQDNTARWMAPASWVFLGKGQWANGVFLNKKEFPPALSGLAWKMPCWSSGAPTNRVRDAEGHLTVPWSQLVYRSRVWESGAGLCGTVQ